MGGFEVMLTIDVVGEVCPDTAEYLYNQQLVAPRAIEMFGSEEVTERDLPGVTDGGETIVIGL